MYTQHKLNIVTDSVLIYRYFQKELLATLITVTTIITVIFLGNQLIRYLGNAAAGEMALGVLGRLIILEIPYLLSLLLPLTFFIAILLTLGRFCADNEMIVLQAAGFGGKQRYQLIRKVLWGVVVLVAFLSLWAQPRLALYRDELLATTNAGASINTIVPGKFQASHDNRYVFYINQSSVDHHHLSGLFVAEAKDADQNPADSKASWNIVAADQGEMLENLNDHAEYLVISNGKRYSGLPGQMNFDLLKFIHYNVLLRSSVITDTNQQIDALSTTTLITLAKSQRLAAAELEWRLSLPIAALLLALLALPLGHLPPRQNRYSRLIIGILIFIVYVNFLFITRTWLMSGKIYILPGLAWIHLLLLALIIYFVLPENWRTFFFRRHQKSFTS